jgi:alkaline phosphatase D
MAFIITRRNILTASAAGLVLAGLPGRAAAAPVTGFTHGVASGDPRQTSVVLWARYVHLAP